MSKPRELTAARVRTLIIDVDGGSPDDIALEQGLEIELLGVVWAPRFVTHGRGATRVWELKAIRRAGSDH